MNLIANPEFLENLLILDPFKLQSKNSKHYIRIRCFNKLYHIILLSELYNIYSNKHFLCCISCREYFNIECQGYTYFITKHEKCNDKILFKLFKFVSKNLILLKFVMRIFFITLIFLIFKIEI